MEKELKKRFLKKYRSMNQEEKLEMMYMDGQPYTWNPMYIEVQNDTKMGKRFLKYLRFLGKI